MAKSIKSVQSVLAGDYFSRLRAADARMRALQKAIDNVLAECQIPADDCRVVCLQDDELRLLVESAAIAARMRQILPVLRQTLNNAGFFVARVRLLRFPDGGMAIGD